MPLCSRGQQALVSVTELSPPTHPRAPPPPSQNVPLEWAGPPGQEVGSERSPGPLLRRDEPKHKFMHSQIYTNMVKYTLEHTHTPLYFYYTIVVRTFIDIIYRLNV